MNTQAVLSGAEKLHADAALRIRAIPYRYKGQDYLFDFDGHNCVCRSKSGERVANFNTRNLSVAKRWLREYMDN